MSTLRNGDSVARYRVVSSIGAGGMGEVYKAVDESLGRPVALKILPPDLVKNQDRVSRFVQEAKSASSLSHPHIVTIHEIGEAELPEREGPGVHFIAMEFVDGRTLTRAIHEERTDLRALVSYLAQAADALAKAHAAGIVHRDLKPENIMISKDGYAKVLDFGLAKLTEKRAGDAASNAPTAQRERTREGVVMGTVPYMSPEQVQGKPVDHRSDIFSFGSILYEAATRQRAFDAETDVDIMHKILHDKPAPIEGINPAVPAELRRLIRRCLTKDPAQRAHSMKDLSIELNEIAEEWDQLSTSTSSSSGSGPVAIVARRPSPATAIAVGVSLAIALAAVIFAILNTRKKTPEVPQKAQSTLQIRRLTGSGTVKRSAISPDGKYVAYSVRESGGETLLVRQVGTGAEVPLFGPTSDQINGFTFTPDGNYLYFVLRKGGVGTLYQAPSIGGAPRKLLVDVDGPVAFSPDGKRLAFLRGYQPAETALMVANADGSALRKLATSSGKERYQEGYHPPGWSPDGASIAVGKSFGDREALVIVDVATSKERAVPHRNFFHLHGPAWLANGREIVVVAAETAGVHAIWLIAPDGSSRRLTNDIAHYSEISVTADGQAIAATQGTGVSNLFSVDTARTATQLTRGTQIYIHQLTARRDRLFYIADDGSGRNIWSAGLDGSDARLIAQDPGGACCLSATLDGKTVLFISSREGGVPRVFAVDGDGSNIRQLTTEAADASTAVSPDGTWFVYRRSASAGELVRASMNGGQPTVIARDFLGRSQISADGAWISGVFVRGLNYEVRTYPTAGGPPRVYPVPGPEAFMKGGDRISYLEGDLNIVSRSLDGRTSTPMTEFKQGTIRSFAITPDGKTLYIARGEDTYDVVLVTNFN